MNKQIPPIFFRPPPHVGFEQGYFGVRPDHGPEARMQGNVEVRLRKGKAVRLVVELRLVERWGKDQRQVRVSRVNDRQYELWKSISEGREPVSNMDMPFTIAVPPYLPSSLATDPKTGVGITYTLLATLFLRIKGTFGRWNEEVLRQGQVVIVEKYDTLPAWPIYRKPMYRDVRVKDILIRLRLAQSSVGLQDRLPIDVIVENDNRVSPVRIRKLSVRINEMTIIRIPTKKGISKRIALRELTIVKENIKKVYVHAHQTVGPEDNPELRLRVPFPIGYDRVSARGSVVEVAHTYTAKVKMDGYDDIIFKNMPFLLTSWTIAESYDIAAQIGPCDAARQTEPIFMRSEPGGLPKMPEYQPTIVPPLPDEVEEDPYDSSRRRSGEYDSEEPDPRFFHEEAHWEDRARDDWDSTYPESQYDGRGGPSYSTSSLPDLNALSVSDTHPPRQARTPPHVRTISALTSIPSYPQNRGRFSEPPARNGRGRTLPSDDDFDQDACDMSSTSSHGHRRHPTLPESNGAAAPQALSNAAVDATAARSDAPQSAVSAAQRKAMMARYLEAKAAVQKTVS